MKVASFILLAVVLSSNFGSVSSLDDSQNWGASPSMCSAVGSFVTCPWTPPKWLPENETCEMLFRLPEGHAHESEPFCQSLSNWSRCPATKQTYECQFPSYDYELKESVFNSCGPKIEIRVNCSDGSVSEVASVEEDKIVVPGPVTNLSATAAGSSEIVVKWARPKNWKDGDMLLKFVLEYEQEYSSDVYKYEQEDKQSYANVYQYFIRENLFYADALTTIRVGVYYMFNPLEILSEWSTVQVETGMAAPARAPQNIRLSRDSVDWKKMERSINLTWDPIPDKFSGGPIERYIVTLKFQSDDGGTMDETVSTEAAHTLLDLHPTYQYKIDVVAENQVGRSNHGEFVLEGLKFEPSKKPYYLGIGVTCCVLLLLLISCGFVLRKKMKASHLPAITFPEKPVTININLTKKEEEVFDTLKSGVPLSMQNNYSSNMEKMAESLTPVLTKNGTQLPKLDLSKKAMPLAKDADLNDDGGDTSPTDSGLNCDYTPESVNEMSPIPVAFHPRTVSSNSSEFGIFDQEEIEVLIGQDSQVTEPTANRNPSADVRYGSGDGNRHPEGYSVHALASSDSDGNRGDDKLVYTQVSERPTMAGYVGQTPALPTGSGSNSASAYQGSGGSGTSDGTIASYVQHVEVGTSPQQDGGSTKVSTSGVSDCSPYFKQSETTPSDMV